MDYLKHYNLLISKALSRTGLDGYSERHHIIPRCMGGTDEESNLVRLTASEHYIAHLLLVKIYPNQGKLIYAANMMCVDAHGGRSNNKRYSWLKTLWVEQMRKDAMGRKVSDTTRLKMSKRVSGKGNPMYGLRGPDHPAFGINPWRTYTSRDRRAYLYADDMYQWYHETKKKYKVAGHKRYLTDRNLTLPAKSVRTCLLKIAAGWVPAADLDWVTWKDQYERS